MSADVQGGGGSSDPCCAATSRVCRQGDDLGSYGIVLCNRFHGHEGQHEAVAYDHAWGPQEPTGKWVGDKWVPRV